MKTSNRQPTMDQLLGSCKTEKDLFGPDGIMSVPGFFPNSIPPNSARSRGGDLTGQHQELPGSNMGYWAHGEGYPWILLGKVSETRHPVSSTRMSMIDVQKGLIGYAAKHRGRWPSTLAEASPYMANSTVPLDGWGRPFRYLVYQGERGYFLLSLGADGMIGGEGDDVDLQSDEDWP